MRSKDAPLADTTVIGKDMDTQRAGTETTETLAISEDAPPANAASTVAISEDAPPANAASTVAMSKDAPPANAASRKALCSTFFVIVHTKDPSRL